MDARHTTSQALLICPAVPYLYPLFPAAAAAELTAALAAELRNASYSKESYQTVKPCADEPLSKHSDVKGVG